MAIAAVTNVTNVVIVIVRAAKTKSVDNQGIIGQKIQMAHH